ncbi:MAG TPA: diacylglycerol kinase family protein [Actinomycetota bacterium]|nr:diacylglycerol kinase family protein [Actinomycetota bacterium]
MAGYLLVRNPRSGSQADEELAAEARRRLPDVDSFDLEPRADLAGAIDRALLEDRVVVAAGGDGTVNAVAQHLVARGTLGILPGGTLNHFARDIGVRDPDRALETLWRGEPRAVDLGRADGRVFVNNAGLGLYPEVVRERQRSEQALGRWVAALRASIRVLRGAEPLMGSISVDGDARQLEAWILLAGNNRFGTASGRIGTRERLDEGVLDVWLLTAVERGRRPAKLAWAVLRDRAWRGRRLVRTEGRQLEIHLEGRPRLLSLDGEIGEATDRLVVEIVPRALRVLHPV